MTNLDLPPYKGNIYETKEKALEHLEIIKYAFEDLGIKVVYKKDNSLDELNAIIDSTYLKLASHVLKKRGVSGGSHLQ